MKIASRWIACLALGSALVSTAAWAETQLLAPVYPGAVPDKVATGDSTAFFLSKDPIEKVQMFYEGKLGKMTRDGGNTNVGIFLADHHAVPVPDGEEVQMGKTIMPQGRVASFLKSVTDAYDAGVVLQARKKAPAKSSASAAAKSGTGAKAPAGLPWSVEEIQAAQAKMQAEAAAGAGLDPAKYSQMTAMSDLFEGLRNEVLRQKHSTDELLAAYAKYKHLETSVYPYVHDKGAWMSYDAWRLKQEKQRNSGQGAAEDQRQFAQKVQQLYMAGKADEAVKLTDRMAAQMNHDSWQSWMAFLRDLDAHAYRTRIVVDVDPRSWSLKH